ncbi:protein brunelleschi isoform X1 [Frankliniella occidentalis]|uniref:Protein brunelleschi isoform X1 n=1 Tax=Frankliniella occidentalis TaxID=133901 RepID=A0A6J1T4X8_FRAOC|nr:protein brunelleschi isoform X1 [Frankliniella occidentalis]
MRSSVSYILSSPAPDTRMSHPDYDQIAQDHASILILVHHQEGLLKPKSFTKVWDKIRRVNHTKVTDSAGVTRQVYIRYVKDYPVESNDWGEFQTHRRLLGLISVGQYESQTDLNEICRFHESLKVRYTTTLYDSRCILFGKENEELQTPSNFKSLPLWYSDVESCSDLESQVSELLNSLFWVLESKRQLFSGVSPLFSRMHRSHSQERSREKLDRVPLLLAPFERKDIVGLDLESRTNKKKCMGRMIKHLGDLSLQAGVPHEALQHYISALDTLRSVNDWLWLGGAAEGLCSASVIVLYPGRWRTFPIQRNASLPPSPGKRRPGLIGPSSLPLGSLTPVPIVEDAPKALSPEGILRRYQEAIQNYAKYQSAGMIETEACFKAAQIAIQQGCPLQAASFLKNVVLINLTLTEQEKIQRFLSLSELYTQMGFHRKASLCRRLAATRHVSDQNRQPDWTQCYNLMLQALDGHRLSLDPTERATGGIAEGWPALQIHLLQQLVVAARRMGHSALATRHMTFLLQTMWHHLNPKEQRELTKQLQKLASECEGAPVPLVLDSRAVIPPANLTNIPLAKNFRLQDLPLHLRPQKIQKLKEDMGPFLYTPISFGSLDRKSTKSLSRMDYVWVEGDMCEVLLDLYNPLPFELKVSNMRLLASEVVFESIPSSIVLPPDSGPNTVVLAGVPKEVGELEIQGYSTHTLGVKSNCQLRHMRHMPQPSFTVEVVPALPHMEMSTNDQKNNNLQLPPVDASVSITTISKSLYAGESTECQVTILNSGSQPIELLEISAQCVLDPSQLKQVLQWSADNIQAQLPLHPGASASFTLYLHGHAEYIAPPRSDVNDGGSQPSSLLSGPSSLPSRLSSLASTPQPSRHAHHNELSSGSFRSQISSRSGSSIGSSRLNPKIYDPSAPKVIDCQLKLRYSGGPGLEAGYCRVKSISLSLEILPSILITSWDVLPAETSSQFYLVLDVTNKTLGELELFYADGKVMLLEGNEECRIAVPVERCPLSKLSKLYQNIELTDVEKAELDSVCSDHVASLVDLKWVLPVSNRSGKASLRGLPLTSDMLDIVRMSPLQWEVLLNKEIAKPLSELTCVAGQCLQLGVTVQNYLDWPLHNVALSLKFFQEYQSGIRNYRLDSQLAVAGAPNVLITQLDDQSSVYHECNVVFFMPGLYKIDIQCSSVGNCSGAHPPGDATESTPAHTWKLIPPIELTVTDP